MAPLLDDEDEGTAGEPAAAEAELASIATRKRSGEQFFDDADSSTADDSEEEA
jgi:hypothetical protein